MAFSIGIQAKYKIGTSWNWSLMSYRGNSHTDRQTNHFQTKKKLFSDRGKLMGCSRKEQEVNKYCEVIFQDKGRRSSAWAIKTGKDQWLISVWVKKKDVACRLISLKSIFNLVGVWGRWAWNAIYADSVKSVGGDLNSSPDGECSFPGAAEEQPP